MEWNLLDELDQLAYLNAEQNALHSATPDLAPDFVEEAVTQRIGYSYRRFQSRVRTTFLPVLAFSVALLFARIPLNAQVQSSINGAVTDATGAVVAGAHVTVTNIATGVVSPAITSSEGTFTIVGLNPGQYSVVVGAAGFQTAQTLALVEVSKTSTLNVQLKPGSTSETVQVQEQASAISLETTTESIGTTLEPELVKTAPLEINGLARQIDSFMFLAPGVQGGATGQANPQNQPGGLLSRAGSHNIDGGVTFENAVQFNGVPVAFVDYSGNQTYINPPYEAVSEFRVNSSTFDAQYGIGQGIVSYNMASGTNTFHGDAFEILRNQLFDSVGFFPTRFAPDGKPEPPVDQQNNYGFTLGGPVIIPKLYNGRNRTFFYITQDWFKQNLAQTTIGTVPTVAMKNGDFSNFVDANGNVVPIYDPTTGQPFPGNIIPKSRFSPLAQALLPYIPDPNRAGIVSGEEQNEGPAVPSVAINQHLWSYTLDHNISNSQSIHFTQWRNSVTEPVFTFAPIVALNNPLQNAYSNSQLGTGFVLNYVKTIKSNLVMTAGADWIGSISGEDNANSKVNFGGVLGSNYMPLIQWYNDPTGLTSWGVSGGEYLQCCLGGLTRLDNRKLGLAFVNNWLWTKGRHSFNIGGEIRKTYQDILTCQFCAGTFNFSSHTTSTPNSSDPNFGNDGSAFASFLLGQVDAAEIINSNEARFRAKSFSPYVQDNIRINKKLNVNLGVRWDVLVPFTETSNNIIYNNPNEPNPGAGGILGAATKFGNCQGCSGVDRAPIHWRYFQPRVGFAYSINNKTVIRSGFYITMLDGGAYEYGTSQSAAFLSDLTSGEFLRASTGSSVPGYGSWDSAPLSKPASIPFSPTIANGVTIFAFDGQGEGKGTAGIDEAGTAPYLSAWSFGVQRELPWKMFVTATYVGNRAVHLPTTLKLNDQPNPSVLQYGALLGDNILSAPVVAAGFTQPYPGFAQQFGASATLEQALEPFPQYGGYFPVYEMDGSSFFNALQVQGEKRFSGGLAFLSDLMISRNTANTAVGSGPDSPNGLNAYDVKTEYTPSSLDQLYIVKVAATYDLPVGRGKPFLNSGWLSRLAGGWQVSAILDYEGGNPFGAQEAYNPLAVNGFDRPNIVPGVQLKTFNYNLSKEYFEGKLSSPPVQFTTNAFSATGPWQVGDSLRNYAALRTPPLRIENFSAMKYFAITERLKATLRVDYFNAFNRTQLQPPDNQILDSTFGQITNLSSQIPNRQGQATFRLEF